MQLNELRDYKPQILAKAKEYGLENIRVALPKNGRSANGDVTLVVDYKPGVGWGYFSFATDMEGILHCDVSVLTDDLAADELHKPLISDIVPL